MKMKKRWVITAAILLLGFAALLVLRFPVVLMFLLHPPEKSADAAVRSGSYWRINQRYATPEPVAEDIIKLEIDRTKGLTIFHLRDGSSVQAALAGSDQVIWTKGCPTMVNSTRMEYLPLAVEKLVLGGTTFENPYLAGTCPAPPYVIVLGEGPQDVAGIRDAAFCAWYEGARCIYFGMEYVSLHIQARDRASDEPLPDAHLILQAPWGAQEFAGYAEFRLPGDARFPLHAEARGYIPYQGEIEIQSNVVFLREAGSTSEAPSTSAFYKIVTTKEVNLPVYLDPVAATATATPTSMPAASPTPPPATATSTPTMK
jgi:hypothetical protein